jgi:DNA-binding winged helix-turn-helix (wHTH) protein
MSMKAGEIFHFGESPIDARARTLRREDEIVTLNYRAFDVLLYFAQNPERALTRDELLKNAWPDTYVDEHSLAQSLSVLRRALDETPGDNGYIVTLPGRGVSVCFGGASRFPREPWGLPPLPLLLAPAG